MTHRSVYVGRCCMFVLALLVGAAPLFDRPARAAADEAQTRRHFPRAGQVDPLKEPPEAGHECLAFGYFELTQRELDKPKRGEKGKKAVLLIGLADDAPANARVTNPGARDAGLAVLRETHIPISGAMIEIPGGLPAPPVKVRKRGAGSVIVVSNLPPGAAHLNEGLREDAGRHDHAGDVQGTNPVRGRGFLGHLHRSDRPCPRRRGGD
jgi:hypothetical protein